MGAEYRGGEYYGSSTTINDNVISEKSTWSSEKIAGQIDDISVTGNKTWSSWEINSRINEKADSSVIAPVETDVIASRAYAIGEHFIKNGKFCTAKTAIAQNEAFTLNTNYTAGTVGNSIKALEESPQFSYVTNIINAVDRSSSITDVTSNLYFMPKLKIGIVTIYFSTTSTIDSSGACLGNWVSYYIPATSRPIVPLIENSAGKVDGSLYANSSPNVNTKLMVYSLTSATAHYAQFPVFLRR